MKIGIIGGGAAGFFAAIHASAPGTEVTIFEKSPKLLSKVKVSGGGRCNVTHRPMEISKLVKNYPRGEKFLKRVFPKFKSEDTIKWFESRGVALKIEADGRMFPVSDSSQSIIDVLLKEAKKLNITIRKSCGVKSITPADSQYKLETDDGTFLVDKLIIATGGHPKLDSYSFLQHFRSNPITFYFQYSQRITA